MILSNEGIKAALLDGTIGIDPRPSDDHIETSAVDLTLSNIFNVWKQDLFTSKSAEVVLNLKDLDYIGVAAGYLTKASTDSKGCLLIPPFHTHPWHLLAQTEERIYLSHKVAARVEGRSSLARAGLIVHLTAPIIHSGFDATITLEMINFGPFQLKLVPGMRICQIVFEKLDTPASGEIRTVFQHQTGPSGTH